MAVAKVAVEKASYGFDRLYDYEIPPQLAGRVRPGCRVQVPFAGGRTGRVGLVVEVCGSSDFDRLKPILALLEEEPLLDEEGLELLRFLKEQYFCTWFDGLRLLIPAGAGMRIQKALALTGRPAASPDEAQAALLAWLKKRGGRALWEKAAEKFSLTEASPGLVSLLEEGALCWESEARRRVLDEKVTMVRLAEGDFSRLTEAQQAVVDFLRENPRASLKELCYYAPASRAVTDRMRKKGMLLYYEEESLRTPYEVPTDPCPAPVLLTGAQQQAFDRLERLYQTGGQALLYGVTGSGKTQVYLKLIEEAAARGDGVILLVPEISLTPQLVQLFKGRFGSRVAVLHSGLSLGERLDEWKRIRTGEAAIAIGTRSAVFAPVRRLRLIVLDEEQEASYKSENAPRYHAREVAAWRCRRAKGLLLLASATPSVETFAQARRGRLELVRLGERYAGALLPDVYLEDMSLSLPEELFSPRLAEGLYENLQRGEQSILLLNRRGFFTAVQCSSCHEPVRCPNCSVTLTYHSANGRLMCHYCGYSQPMAASCPSCGSQMIRCRGAGTQKVEEALHQRLPEARVLRMDMDTTLEKYSYDRFLKAFGDREYDILVGTQMVAKGLDFPAVTLVGVLGADQSLYSGDYRSYERTFSLLTQVVGRSGRGGLRGRAVIQTMNPQHPVLELAARQDYEGFFSQEIALRKVGLYPPYCRMWAVGFTGADEAETAQAAEDFCARFSRMAGEEYPRLPLRILGPAPSAVYKIAGKYRYKLIVKCKNSPQMRELMRRLLEEFYQDRRRREVGIQVDTSFDGML